MQKWEKLLWEEVVEVSNTEETYSKIVLSNMSNMNEHCEHCKMNKISVRIWKFVEFK